MKNVLIFGGIGLGIYYLWNKSNINFNIVGVKLNPARVIFDIYNPTNQAVNFNSIVCDLFYNGNRVAILNSFGNEPIPPNSHKSITIPIAGDALGFVGMVTNLIQQGVKNIQIDLKGSMNVNNISIPINKPYKLL